jgi:hypothetical protein
MSERSTTPEPKDAQPNTGPTDDQFIRMTALAAATGGGLRDPENAINDAVIYARWIKTGSRY